MIGIIADFVVKHRKFFVPLLMAFVLTVCFVKLLHWAKSEGKNECRNEYAAAEKIARDASQKKIVEVNNVYDRIKKEIPKDTPDCSSAAFDGVIDGMRNSRNR